MANQSVADRIDRLPLRTADQRAKADLRKPESWRALGLAIEATWKLSGLSLKEFAGVLDRDERQVARWCAGDERPQVEAVYDVPRFKGLLVIALAAQAEGVEVTTEIRIRKVS